MRQSKTRIKEIRKEKRQKDTEDVGADFFFTHTNTHTHTHTNTNARRVSAGFQSAHGFRVSLVSAYSSTAGSRLLIERAVRRRKRRHAAVHENTCCRRQPLIFGSWLYPSRNAAQRASNNCTLRYVFRSCSKRNYFTSHQVCSNCGERC